MINNLNLDCPKIEVRFSPDGDIAAYISYLLDQEDEFIRVQAFSFTSPVLAGSLIRAHKRGANVQVILDPENLRNKNSVLKVLNRNNIQIYIDNKHNIAHNKIILVRQKKRIITGSYNFSRSAEEHNAENVVFISDNTIFELYNSNWEEHKKHSKIYDPEEPIDAYFESNNWTHDIFS